MKLFFGLLLTFYMNSTYIFQPRENLEYRLSSSDLGISYDIFFTYRSSKKDAKQWCSYHVDRKVYHRNVPNFSKLCSAELLDNLYMVPCNPIEYLDCDYGPDGWQTPKEKEYHWPSLKIFNEYSDRQYIKSLKFFFENGTFDSHFTLEVLNEDNGLKEKLNHSLYLHYLKVK